MVGWIRKGFRGEVQHGSINLAVINIEMVLNAMRS